MTNTGNKDTLMDQFRLEQTAKAGASWFYWIAGMSAVNSLMMWFQAGMNFPIGLGMTQFFDALGAALGGFGVIAAVALDIVVIGIFAFVGYMAHRHRAAYIVGAVLYCLDGLLMLVFGDFLGIGFHVFALFFIFKGFSAARTLANESAPVPGGAALVAPGSVVENEADQTMYPASTEASN